MNIIPLLQKELDYEVEVLRKFLQRVPDDRLDWKPHEKSMSMRHLTVHLAELPSWVNMALTTTELDFSKIDYKPTEISNKNDLLEILEKSAAKGRATLTSSNEDDLLPEWTLRTGDHIHMVMTKYEVIRHALSQITHHRAQLGVYLRLLDIPIPGSYGPSADEMNF